MFWTWWVQLQAKMQSHLVESALGKARTPRCKGTDYMGCISLLHHKGLACKFLFATKFTLIGPRPQRDQGGVDTGQCPLDTGVLGKAGLADLTRLSSSTKKGGATAWCAIGPDETHDLNRRPLKGVVRPSLTTTWRTQTTFHSCHSRSRQTLLLATFLPSAQGSFLPSSSES